jgi:predicted permease
MGFALFLITIYGCLLLGYGARLAAPRHDVQGRSRMLTRFFLIYIVPFITLNSFWSIELRGVQYLTLPLVSVILQSLAIGPALLLARLLGLGRSEKGSFVACAVFSNTGPTLGVFLCFLLFGEKGLYLGSWYITLYLPFYYFVGFPLMSAISGGGDTRFRDALLELVRNPVSIISISAMCVGLILNLAGVARPEPLNLAVKHVITYLSSAGFSFAIGLGLNFKRSLLYVRHSLWIALIKFLFNPLASLLLVWALGYFTAQDTLPLRVAFVESFMPTAILAVVLAKLFELNDDLANAAWILSTFIVVPIIPGIIYAQNLLPR